MPTILDSLVISLGLDGKGVIKGAKGASNSLKTLEDQAGHTQTTLVETGKKAGDGFSAARREALALLAVFTGGRSLKAFTSEITRANAQLGYTAERLNMDPRQLYQAQKAVEAVGGSAAEVEATFSSLQNAMLEPAKRAQLKVQFGGLGITNFDELVKQGPQALYKALNRAVQNQPRNVTTPLLQQLGFGNGEINMIDMTTKAFDNLQKKFAGLGPTNKQIKDFQQLREDWEALTATTETLSGSLFDKLVPGLDMTIKRLEKLEKEHPDYVEAFMGITAAVAGLITILGGLATARGYLALIRLPKLLNAAGAAEGASSGVGLLRFAGPEGAIAAATGAALWKPTEAGGPVEKWALSTFGDPRLQKGIRWFFGDKSGKNYNPSGNATKALSILQGMGFSRNAALGIVGNIAQESQFDPNKRGDSGHAVGLGQWHEDRVMQILRRTGIDVRSALFEDQVRAYGLELQSGIDDKARQAGQILNTPGISVFGAVHAVRSLYERPADKDGNEDFNRYQMAIAASQITPSAQAAQNKTEIHIGDIHVTSHGRTNGQQIGMEIHNELRRTLPHITATGLV